MFEEKVEELSFWSLALDLEGPRCFQLSDRREWKQLNREESCINRGDPRNETMFSSNTWCRHVHPSNYFFILFIFFFPVKTMAVRWTNHWSFLAVLKENLNWWLLCTLMETLQQRLVFDVTAKMPNFFCLETLMLTPFSMPTSMLLGFFLIQPF